MKNLIVVFCIFCICQSCSTTSTTFNNTSARTFSGSSTGATSGYTDADIYSIQINPGLNNYQTIKNGIKNTLSGSVNSGAFRFLEGSGPISTSGIIMESGSEVPADVNNVIIQYLRSQGYSVEWRRNQPGLGKMVSIW